MPCTLRRGLRVRPSVGELGDRHTGVDQDRSPRARARLGQLLGGHDAHRKAGVDELGSQPFGRRDAAVEDAPNPTVLA